MERALTAQPAPTSSCRIELWWQKFEHRPSGVDVLVRQPVIDSATLFINWMQPSRSVAITLSPMPRGGQTPSVRERLLGGLCDSASAPRWSLRPRMVPLLVLDAARNR